MERRIACTFVPAAALALASAGLIFTSGPVVAQQSEDEAIEEIVVEAPLQRQVKRTMRSTVETIQLTRRVNYSDLDLSRHGDVLELEARIEATAEESCRKLDEMYPLTSPDMDEIRRCTRKAVDGTKDQLQAAIVTASGS